MKLFFLRALVMWRRFRRGSRHHGEHHLQFAAQAEAFMQRANPFASWRERADWMIDITEWIRREPTESRLKNVAWRRVKHRRIRILLDWLDANRDTKRVVQATLQKTLREAAGAELFFTTGLPRETAFLSEMSEKLVRLVFPQPPVQLDLSALFMAMFSDARDADWLLQLDHGTLSRIWKLCADDGITHAYRQQIDEALLYLVTVILSVGISPAFRQRLDASNSLQATPFMALRRELEKYLQVGVHDEAALRSVRMLIAVCQAQTERIYAHLDENGVSLGLVYSIERMRAQLARMARLIDLRAAATHPNHGSDQTQALLIDMIAGHGHRSSMRELIRRSFSLLARKMVERNATQGRSYGAQSAARNPAQYRTMFTAALLGGTATVFTVLGQMALSNAHTVHFFEGIFASLNYLLSFTVIAVIGGALAATQPAVTAPALVSRMGELDTDDGLHALLLEVAVLVRVQAAAVLGNLMALVPVMAAVSFAIFWWSGAPVMAADSAHAKLHALSILGATPIFAAITGVLLWCASLTACFTDNWFALRRLRESLAQHRRLVHALGTVRAERWAAWLERNVAGIVGNVSLAVILGMAPVFVHFFGLPFEIRHVTLAAGTLVASVSSLGWHVFEAREFWLAASGIAAIGLLNVGVAFACSLMLALRIAAVPTRIRRLVFKLVLKQFVRSPRFFLFADRQNVAAPLTPRVVTPASIEEKRKQFKNGG